MHEQIRSVWVAFFGWSDDASMAKLRAFVDRKRAFEWLDEVVGREISTSEPIRAEILHRLEVSDTWGYDSEVIDPETGEEFHAWVRETVLERQVINVAAEGGRL